MLFDSPRPFVRRYDVNGRATRVADAPAPGPPIPYRYPAQPGATLPVARCAAVWLRWQFRAEEGRRFFHVGQKIPVVLAGDGDAAGCVVPA